MKLTVLTWLKDSSVTFVGKLIEILFRITLFLLPLGAYILLMQSRTKASSIRNISVFTNDSSTWQHVYPGIIMVTVNPSYIKEKFISFRKKFNNWFITNKYLIEFLLAAIIVVLMIIIGVAK